jgi:hypothetical protein
VVGEGVPVEVLFRGSERKAYRECRLEWHWKYDLRLNPPVTRGALEFGRGVHKALEVHYPPGRKRGPHPAKAFDQWMDANDANFAQWDEEGNRHDARELGVTMLEEYVRLYGDEDHILIVQPEMPMRVPVFDKQGRYLCTWVGRSDALYEDLSLRHGKRRRLGFMEHKTAKSIDQEVRVNSGYGDQGLGYAWAGSRFLATAGLLPPGECVDHVLFNWLRKALPDERPRNAEGHALNKPSKDALLTWCADNGIEVPKKATVDILTVLIESVGGDPAQLGEVSQRQGTPNFHRQRLDYGDHEMEQTSWRIAAEAWERSQVRQGKLPIYKNPAQHCSWCDFKEACELHEMGGDWKSVLELEFEQWDPYEGHEEEIK